MKKTYQRILWGICAALVIAIMAATWLWHDLLHSPFELTEPAYICVRPSTSEADIVVMLRDEAHARHVRGWQLASHLLGFTPHTGRYVVRPGESMLSVFRKLKHGRQEPVRFTLPSVRSLDRLAGVMGQRLMLDSATIMQAFADTSYIAQWGYTRQTFPALFIPNTYELYWDTTLDAFMERMLRENDNFWQRDGRNLSAEAMGMTHEEVITLASIVDEETANNGEKPRVAGMYVNRLKQDMPLQADPTVKFAVGDATLRRIRGEHLRVQSPYNTYQNTGLPPGPIRIPSVAGIDAVLRHEHHTYIYMCAKEDFSGTHNFATTYAEHQQNARKYQKALNARGIK